MYCRCSSGVKMALYVSASCLKTEGNIFRVLNTYYKNGIKNVELGPWAQSIPELDKIKQYDLNFLVHHYFPPPPVPFIVNLASQNETILESGRKQMRDAIDFCNELGIKLFTFHAGFRVDPDINLQFPKDKPITCYEKVFNTFVESAQEINDYAQQRGVKLAIENNVLSEYNLVDDENEFLLLCEADEFKHLFEKIPSANLGILLDLGHLKVTSHFLNFDRYEFIEKVKEKIFAIHTHDNNGNMDTHGPLNKTSWCLEVISKKCFAQIPVVLESTNLTIDQVLQQLHLMENAANYDAD